jgi:predicted permease
VQLVRLRIPSAQVREPERLFQIQREVRDRIAAMSGVTAVSFASSVPLDERQSGDVLFAEDRTYPEGTLPPVRSMKFITPGFFSTIGTPLLAGRDLTWADVDSRRPVAVVSETVARETWQDPVMALGKRIRVDSDNPWREIVGVVGDIYDDGLREKASPVVYFPIFMENYGQSRVFVQQSVTFAIRSPRTGRDGFLNEIRAAVSSVTPDVPLSQVRSLRTLYDRSMARTSFALVMLAIAGGMALLLGVVGLYGVISYTVAQRTREMGIRAALGAEQGQLKRMFVMNGLLLTLVGIVLGMAGALGVTQLLGSLLYGVRPLDPATYGAGALVLVAAAMLASYVPARRAARVDPLLALRYE